MAKLGTPKARWTRTTDRVRTEYALRADGKVVRKRTWYHEDGTVDFSDGWKLVGIRRTDQPGLFQTLEARGYARA